jgi:cytochrome c553
MVHGRATTLLLLASLAVAILGCRGSASRIRQYTYPPDFRYIEQHELGSAMGRLAVAVERLNGLLRASGTGEAAVQGAVVVQLGEVESIAGQLTGGLGTNHPWLDHNLATFQRDIELARRAANHDPPNYYLAGSIAGACGYCHQRRE